MILQIDGISTDVCEGESLQDIVRRLHLDSDSLKTRPLAAQLAGETFTLGYVPIKKSKEEEIQRFPLATCPVGPQGLETPGPQQLPAPPGP